MQQQLEALKLRQKQISKQAIALALAGQWAEAVDVNKSIIESFPDDVDAHNRLGRAYLETGNIRDAKEAYRTALGIDPYNMIAKKNLERLAYAKDNVPPAHRPAPDKAGVKPQHFIEEVGKAGTVSLTQIAGHESLATISAGDVVKLEINAGKLTVTNGQGKYIGLIDQKHGQRLQRLMQGGNRYSALVSSITKDTVTVLIREEYQDPGQLGVVSFPPKPVRVARSLAQTKAPARDLDLADAEEEEEGESRAEEEPEREAMAERGFEIETGEERED